MRSDNLVDIASFYYPLAAHMAKANLEAAHIPAFLTDEHTINMQWLYSDALGGVSVLVPFGHEEEAKKIIEEDFTENSKAEVETEETLCPHSGSRAVNAYTIGKKAAFLVFLLLGFPLSFYKHGINCNNCKKISKA